MILGLPVGVGISLFSWMHHCDGGRDSIKENPECPGKDVFARPCRVQQTLQDSLTFWMASPYHLFSKGRGRKTCI